MVAASWAGLRPHITLNRYGEASNISFLDQNQIIVPDAEQGKVRLFTIKRHDRPVADWPTIQHVRISFQ